MPPSVDRQVTSEARMGRQTVRSWGAQPAVRGMPAGNLWSLPCVSSMVPP